MDKNILVIDSDFPQHSIYNMRLDDRKTVEETLELQIALAKQFDIYGKKAYPVVKAASEKALDEAYSITGASDAQIDAVLFDLPGTVNNAGIINLILNMDYIFIPITADKRVLQSSLAFILTIREYMKALDGKINLKQAYMFWNKVDKREHTELYANFNKIMKAEKINLLKTQIPDTKRYNKELSAARPSVFRSTLFPPERRLLINSNLDKLAEEICSITNL